MFARARVCVCVCVCRFMLEGRVVSWEVVQISDTDPTHNRYIYIIPMAVKDGNASKVHPKKCFM